MKKLIHISFIIALLALIGTSCTKLDKPMEKTTETSYCGGGITAEDPTPTALGASDDDVNDDNSITDPDHDEDHDRDDVATATN